VYTLNATRFYVFANVRPSAVYPTGKEDGSKQEAEEVILILGTGSLLPAVYS
jgi:hypothetical protein